MELDPLLNGDGADGAPLASLTHRHRDQTGPCCASSACFAARRPDRAGTRFPDLRMRDLAWTIAKGLAGHSGATLFSSAEQPRRVEARFLATGDGR